MPFYRSIVGAGSGGGGGSSSVTFDTSGEQPLLCLSGFEADDDSLITKVTMGNQIVNADHFMDSSYNSVHENFNAVVNLYDAEYLSNAGDFFNHCNGFNSTVIFPNVSHAHENMGSYGYISYALSFDGFFDSCYSYNQPTTIRFHEVSSPNNKPTRLGLNYFFTYCDNFNSRVVFDFDKLNKNENDFDYSVLLYSVEDMFYYCNNFNQPMFFPSGIASIYGAFDECNNFNQPVVINLYGMSGYAQFTNLFKSSPLMTSDIIFLNSNEVNQNSYSVLGNESFNNIVCRYNASNANCRQGWINIFIDNCDAILNGYLSNGKKFNSTDWVKTYDSTYECNIYSNDVECINIFDSTDYALNSFNEYYNNLYGEYPVIY